MEIKFDVKMTAQTMYDFMLYHSYRNFQGVFGTFLGAAVLILAIMTFGDVSTGYTILYLAFAVIFLVYTPLGLYTKAKRQVAMTPAFKKPITYILNPEGIATEQDGNKAQAKWSDIYKVRKTKKSLLLYLNKVNAVILPIESMGVQYDEVAACIREHIPENRVRIKASRKTGI
ncbi:YcxB family protein [Diplocloster modestus]|uniref:YcxB family protein n=1 Tax=Diplocloster modestus TaxID=2850322 RepID=A0ABS6K7E0_9FIRM|nr:YcxB family protein [Diplocloster modestus]MBU9726412.1 YcxB family protein [Diplocloster modestus]